MRANDAANLLRRLTVESTKSFLERLPKARSEKLVELLRYPEATVGGMMSNDMVVTGFGSNGPGSTAEIT